MYVVPEERRHGVARLVLSHVEAERLQRRTPRAPPRNRRATTRGSRALRLGGLRFPIPCWGVYEHAPWSRCMAKDLR